MKHLLRITALLLALSLCVLPVWATEPEKETSDYFTEWSEGLDEIMADYMAEHGLTEDNFAMGYLYTGTGEYWYFNEEAMMIGGSIYKLPLNMAINDKVAAGERSLDDSVGGHKLPEAQHQSITFSNNTVSMAMQKYVVGVYSGYYRLYRTEIAKYCGTPVEELPQTYWNGNYFSANFMLNTLVYLYEHSGDYENIIGYMKESNPGRYFRLYEGDYEIAHKYGSLSPSLNDVAIVYTPNPFLLVVLTDGAFPPEQILGEICQLATEYTLKLDAKYEQERQAAIADAAAKAAAAEAVQAQIAAANRSAAEWKAMQKEIEDMVAAIASSAAISTLRGSMP